MIEHRATFPLPAPIDRAFRALVEPDQLSRWFAESVGPVELAPGGAFPFHGRATLGTPDARAAIQTITAIEPGRVLAFRWAIHGVDTHVTWTVHPDGEGARLEDRRLVTDWGDWRGDPDQPATRVAWELEPLADGARTRLTLVHDGFAHVVDRSDYQQGWGHFADELRKVAEG